MLTKDIPGIGYVYQRYSRKCKNDIALESSRSNSQHFETNFLPFSYNIVNLYSCTLSCNEKQFTPMCFLLNSCSHTLAK